MEPDDIKVCFTDEIKVSRNRVRWEKKGVTIDTKWHFREGTELEFAMEKGDFRRNCTGIVVSCQPHPWRDGFYETVLYFVDEPCRELAAELASTQSNGFSHPRRV